MKTGGDRIFGASIMCRGNSISRQYSSNYKTRLKTGGKPGEREMIRLQCLATTSLLACAAMANPVFAQNAPMPAPATAPDPPGPDQSGTVKGASASTQVVSAQDGQSLADIIVTAERREGDVQKTAAAVTVRTGSELAQQGKFLLRQVLDDIPGVSALENNSRNIGSSDVQGNNITIRGISPGESAGPGFGQISATPATAVYVDGVYEGLGSVYDLSRVEVLRGPQGTLYGRSATAGVVSFQTRNPEIGELAANAAAETGSYQLQHYTGGVSLPIGNTIALRLSGDYRNQEQGYFGEADRGLRERVNARAKLLWQPSADLSVLAGYAYEKDKAFSGGNVTNSDRAYNLSTLTSPLFPGRKTQNQYWAEVKWNLGPVSVTYLPAYRTWKQDDLNLLVANFIGSGAQLQQSIETPKNTFHTQELRIGSNGSSAFTWLAGAFYYENVLDTSLRNFLADSSNTEVAVQSSTADTKNTRNIGVFAETTYSPVPDLRFTLGARYDDTRIILSEVAYENDYSQCGTILQGIAPLPPGARCTGPGQASVASRPPVSIDDLRVKFTNFNYKARVEYDLATRNMVYASISTGFRPGDAGFSQNTLNVYDAEKLTAIELGSKNRFLHNTVQVNLAGYYYDYRGFQTTFRPDTPSPADYATQNGQRRTTVPAHVIGGEFETLYQPTSHDRIMLNYNYARFRWYDKPADFAIAQPESGRAVIPHTVTASYQHSFDIPTGGNFVARIDGKFESAHRTSDPQIDLVRIGFLPYATVGDRTVGNAQVTFVTEDKRFSLTAYVRNFTNEKYRSFTLVGNIDALQVDLVDPRIFGLIAAVRF